MTKSSKLVTATTKTTSRDEEIVAILQQIRSEQKEANRRLDEFDKRIGQMESYDYTEYDENNTAYYQYDKDVPSESLLSETIKSHFCFNKCTM